MADTISHRGPDDSGEWCDPPAGYAVGFRRLSIIDLSAAGHQPMLSASGRYVIAFNGEVYNFESIRRELDQAGSSPSYRGHSDTEVMLAAIEAWGLEAAVRKFVGMFAFALWDRRERILHLVRDRLGVKPLYYGAHNGTLLFGSELKPFRKHSAFNDRVRRDALVLYLRHCYIPSPYSVYESYWKLPPGCILSVRDPAAPLPAPVPYWSASDIASAGLASQLSASEAELTEELDQLLHDAIRLRMVADVPVGVFLSGGIDSSTVTAIMQAESMRPVRSFSIGFGEDSFNEAPHAKRIAQHLRTEHTELYLSPEETREVIPKLPSLYDEPFADSSQIPTYLVSQLARQQVTVSLTGDGGDELFCGYDRYTYGADLWRILKRVPKPARRLLASSMRRIPLTTWSATLKRAKPLLPRRMRVQHPGDKIGKLVELLSAEGMDDIYRSLVSSWLSPAQVVVDAVEPVTALTDRTRWPAFSDPTLRMMYFDLVTYLPDDILVKVDRASMGVSLEAREPLLDHRLVEFAWRVPLAMKSRNGVGKWLLRQVLDKYVPSHLVDRPKMGFGVPVAEWMRGPLREWAESLLAESSLRTDGYFDANVVRARWQSHLENREFDFRNELWAVLMFQAWLRNISAH
jgi:asparagine synthase (glutamine-hydrolysing)